MASEKDLLNKWMDFCGEEDASEMENKKFNKLIEKYGADKVMEAAVFLYAANDGSPKILLKQIRENTVDKWLEQLPKIDATILDDYEAAKKCFEAEIEERCWIH